MKRTVKPFVVERKRRTAGVGDGPPSIWSKADGEAFRQQAEERSSDDTPAKAAAPRPVTRDASKPRILDASVPKPVAHAPEPIAESPPRARRSAMRRNGPEAEIGEGAVPAIAAPTPAMVEPATPLEPPSPPVAAARMSAQRAKRKAARQGLPLHERWKWDLPN